MPKNEINILLIDDDEEDFIITRDILSEIPHRSYSIEWIDTYQKAAEAIIQDRHDVYLVDYYLGISNGLEIIEEFIEKGSQKPFILLTGQDDIAIDEQATRIGAVDYLVKGELDAPLLERSIRHGIEHAQHLLKIRKLNEELEERVQERTQQLNQAIKELQQTNHTLQKQVKVRKAAEEALKNSQRLYRTIARNFPNGAIIVLDQALNFVLIDGKELAHLDIAQSHFLGNKIFFDALEVDSELYINKESYYQLLDMVFQGDEVNFEVNYRNNLYLLSAVPLPDSRGGIDQILIVAKNITEQRQVEEGVRKALQKEKELNELKSRFVSMASHEFRTPLSTILSSVSLLARYQGSDQQEKRDKHINRIKSSVNNLTQILNDFLSISKLEEGKTSLHLASFTTEELTRQAIEDIEPVLRPGQRIYYSHKGERRPFYSEPHLIKNILINLLSNAIKYSAENKPIEVRSLQEGESLTLEVADRGMGIPKQEQQHLFNRFFRAENAVNIQGTGLGLHIVKKYVDLLEGDINFSSTLEEGTTFSVVLPNATETK